ncbi:hypothetical protein BCR36DRAFT_344413 [Piromyces finnis]|uniref:Uncharacterized protein n=1 Tax=Piromyces finnis TaxID=1754191 RepID=A0A1Y1VJD0_9FUNG|nr:hypothetical protein BCR36DRAFT_344413 [Piromyces finnis]|eukprot:ORX57774.1 hypothetical protein BCR36DRAFT_344413 [Piromyces finnis]
MNFDIETVIKNNEQNVPSILFTYGKEINLFNKSANMSIDTNEIINNINSNENEQNNIIILDSSFNPPTLAHIKLLIETFKFYCEQMLSNRNNANQCFHYTFLLLITNNNVDKKIIGASLSQRLKMMEIVTNIFQNHIMEIVNDSFKEIKYKLNKINILVGLTNVGRFIDKVTAVKRYIPNSLLAFIMGWDTITRFFMKKYYVGIDMKEVLDSFFKESAIICADRIMYNENTNISERKENGELNYFLTEGPAKSYSNKIYILNNWLNDKIICKVSSSEARNILKENYNNQDMLKTILSKEILDFIVHNNIYN